MSLPGSASGALHPPRLLGTPSPTLPLPSSRQSHVAVHHESGERAGHDGAERKKASNVHVAVDRLGHLLALWSLPANQRDRARARGLTEGPARGQGAECPCGARGPGLRRRAARRSCQRAGGALGGGRAVRSPAGLVLLPRRWVVEPSFGRASRFPRIAWYSERLSKALAGYIWCSSPACCWGSWCHCSDVRSTL
jgi:hypothetical protein